jgi:FKBP-type peptidyl-prolyl cis-trans isomerase
VYLPNELAFPEPGPLGGQEVIFVIELLAVLDPQEAPVATGQVDEASSAAARLLNEEESYWQTATGGDSSEPDAEQPSDTESGDNATPRQRIGAEAEQFLAEVAGQDGVISLPSGLKYRVLKKGNSSGRSPTATDTVVLRYRGTLPDGREFDRSQGTAQFSVGELIPGWQEALQYMEEGSRWELYLPPSLAQSGGTRKRGMLGLQPLVYQLELVSINPSDDTPANK